MRDLPIYVAMAAFLLMGMGALARPTLVTAQFGMPDLTAAGRNEVRAVYGGFGVLMAWMLLIALQLIDRRIDRWPLCYLLLEAALALLLLRAM
jgi:hypothetical protein